MFPKIVVSPKWMVKIMENPIKIPLIWGFSNTLFGVPHPYVNSETRMVLLWVFYGFNGGVRILSKQTKQKHQASEFSTQVPPGSPRFFGKINKGPSPDRNEREKKNVIRISTI